jgi:hypothetical protein
MTGREGGVRKGPPVSKSVRKTFLNVICTLRDLTSHSESLSGVPSVSEPRKHFTMQRVWAICCSFRRLRESSQYSEMRPQALISAITVA